MTSTTTIAVEPAREPIQVLINKTQGYKLWLEEHPAKDLLRSSENNFASLTNTYLNLCRQIPIEASTGADTSLESYLLHYLLPEPFKNLALLYRDMTLQLFIGENKLADGEIGMPKMEKLLTASHQVLIKAVESFIAYIQESTPASSHPGKELEKALSRTRHQQNPWPVYAKQFQTILNQLELMASADSTTVKLRATFGQVLEHISGFKQATDDSLQTMDALIRDINQKLAALTEDSSLGEFIVWAERGVENLKLVPNGQQSLDAFLESQFKDFTDIEVPLATEDGLLVTRKLNLDKTVTKWFDYEILPVLIEIWNSSEALWAHLQVSWANLKSGLTLAKNNETLATLPNLIYSAESMQRIVAENRQKQAAEFDKIVPLLEDNLKVSRLLDDEEFLEVSLQSSIAQYSLAKDHLLNRLRKKVETLFTKLGAKYEEASLPTAHKHLEASLECLNHRMSREADSSYDTLFRNKALLGDLFIVHRQDPEKLFVKSIGLWNQDFNQSTLVVGERLSGKTTLMEVLGRKYFAKNLIRLEVNGVVSMEGRKLKLTNDLGEALKQIGNQYHLTRPMIMIDNLEYWRGDNIRLLENVRSLMRFLEHRSDQVYTVVSTTVAMQQHLDQWLPFTQGFSSVINVNRSRTEEIYQAVLVRHGAAHKKLVDANGQPLTVRQIEKEVKDLCRALDHNIGEVLLAWTYNTIAEQNNIVYEPTKLSLEDFFSWHEITLLKYLILYRTIDEVTVKQLFGIRSAPYMSGLKKLINTKVLLREENGQLKLNPVILKDIRDLLKYRGILD